MGASSGASALDRFAGARLLVLGDVMLDRYLRGRVDRMSPEAPVPILLGESEDAMPGGAANVACNIAALGGCARLIGLIGEDQPGQELSAALAAKALIDPILIRDRSRPTTVKTRFMAKEQQLLRLDREATAPVRGDAAAAILAAFDVALPDCDLVLISDYGKGVAAPDIVMAVIERARRLDKRVIVDPKARDLTRYRGAAWITPNAGEAAAATGAAAIFDDQAAAEAAQRIRRQTDIPHLLITRGAQGMTYAPADGAAIHLPAHAREVFDVSGAGDTVLATLGLALAIGMEPIEAVRLANSAAGIVVGKAGTATASPDELAAVQGGEVGGGKIVDLSAAAPRIAGWRADGARIGFTNGCFDLLHPGHLALLGEARSHCDRLIVGLNSDRSVRRLKGHGRPIQPETVRAAALAARAEVDLVLLYDEDTPLRLIEALRPALLVKGADYRLDQVVGADLVASYGGRVLLAEIVPGHSTTASIARQGGRG